MHITYCTQYALVLSAGRCFRVELTTRGNLKIPTGLVLGEEEREAMRRTLLGQYDAARVASEKCGPRLAEITTHAR